MTPLSKTPILREFIKKLFALENKKFKSHIDKELLLHSQCKCGQKDCATVTLKRKKPWKDSHSHQIATGQRIVIIHYGRKGFLQIEAIMYDDFPHKKEIDSFFKNKTKKRKVGLSTLEKQRVDAYWRGTPPHLESVLIK